MSEGNDRQQGPETGTENVGVDEDTLGEAVKGRGVSHETGTGHIEGAGNPGQTQSPAAADDVGVPEEVEDRTD